MEYFILQLDENYSPCWPMGNLGRIDDKTIRDKNAFDLPKFMIFPVQEPADDFPDLIMSPCFMVSKGIMEIIRLYYPKVTATRVVLFSKVKKSSKSYYIPFLEKVNCLTAESRLNLDKSIIQHAVVDGDMLKGKVIVRVQDVNSICVLIRMDLAESILQRHFEGVGLRGTVTVYKKSIYIK